MNNVPVTLGLRPENVLVHASEAANVLWLDGELSHIEYMGSELFAYFRVGTTSITSRVPASQSVGIAGKKRGEPVRIGLELAQAHWFDAGSGNNLKTSH